MRKILTLVVVLAMVYTQGTAFIAYGYDSSLDGSTPKIIVSDASGKIGDEVVVSISLENNPGIAATRLTVNYDADVLQLIGVADKGKLGLLTRGNVFKSPYIMYWDGGIGTENNTYNGEIAALKFKILSKSAYSPITVSHGANDIIDKDIKMISFRTGSGAVSTNDSAVENPENSGVPNKVTTGSGSFSGGVSYAPLNILIAESEVPLAKLQDIQAIYADELYKLGLFLGTVANAEAPVYELEGDLTRIQALVLVIRLMGLEDKALAFNEKSNFADVPDWAWQYAAYAYQNGLTSGVDSEGTLFDPNRNVTCQEFTAFLLRSLGFNEKDGDFLYAETLHKALDVELYDESALMVLSSGEFSRGYAVIAMIEALLTCVNGAEDTLLVYALAENGLFSKEEVKAFEEAIANKTN